MWGLSSHTRDHMPCTGSWILNRWSIREAPDVPSTVLYFLCRVFFFFFGHLVLVTSQKMGISIHVLQIRNNSSKWVHSLSSTHSSILAWKIQWTGEPGGLQSMGLQRVRYNWATKHAHKWESRPLAGSRLFPFPTTVMMPWEVHLASSLLLLYLFVVHAHSYTVNRTHFTHFIIGKVY